MDERVLCERGLRVSLGRGGERTYFALRDGDTVRFWLPTADLERALRDEPLQISVKGNYCRIERIGETVHLEYGQGGELGSQCELPLPEFAEALAWIRSEDGHV